MIEVITDKIEIDKKEFELLEKEIEYVRLIMLQQRDALVGQVDWHRLADGLKEAVERTKKAFVKR